MIPDGFKDAAFWVLFSFMTVAVWLILQCYWTRWAHRRVDELDTKMEEMKKENAAMKADVEQLKKANPYTFLKHDMRRV